MCIDLLEVVGIEDHCMGLASLLPIRWCSYTSIFAIGRLFPAEIVRFFASLRSVAERSMAPEQAEHDPWHEGIPAEEPNSSENSAPSVRG
ncbi:MAG: hypothetical protein ACM3VW_09945 [Bacteroidota bacterium]